MSDTESSEDLSASSELHFLSRLVRGDFGLAKTYWLYGVLVGLGVNLISRAITSSGMLVLFVVAYAVYEVPVLIGTWRAAAKYSGPTIWAVLAKIAVVLGAIVLAVSLLGALALLGKA